MPENVLEKIIKKKIEKIEDSKKNISIDSLNELIEKVGSKQNQPRYDVDRSRVYER